MVKKHPPLVVYFALSSTSSALYSLIFTVNLLYYIFVAKLDPLQLVLVGTALEASIFIFEIPTGVVADSVSRRLSVVIGVFIIGIAFLVNGSWPVFWVIMAAQVLWALGYTFTSGATQAWISDEISEENAGLAYIRGARWDQWGGIVGTVASVFIAILSLKAPILIGGGLFLVLGIYLAFFMPENGYQPAVIEKGKYWAEFARTFKNGIGAVKVRTALVGILAVGFFFGLYSEGYDRLWQAHILERFVIPSAGWFSPAYATTEMSAVFWNALFKIVLMGFSVIATKSIEKRLDRTDMPTLVRILLFLSSVLFICLLGFALTGNLFLSVIFVLVIGVSREMIYPVYTTWVNHRIPSSVRATVLSFSSQVDAVGQTIGGPIVGVVAKGVSILAGLLTSVAMLAPVLPILWGQRKNKPEDLSGD
jgi:MFS transporter, DHA3 family, tetracycline resistance protein